MSISKHVPQEFRLELFTLKRNTYLQLVTVTGHSYQVPLKVYMCSKLHAIVLDKAGVPFQVRSAGKKEHLFQGTYPICCFCIYTGIDVPDKQVK